MSIRFTSLWQAIDNLLFTRACQRRRGRQPAKIHFKSSNRRKLIYMIYWQKKKTCQCSCMCVCVWLGLKQQRMIKKKKNVAGCRCCALSSLGAFCSETVTAVKWLTSLAWNCNRHMKGEPDQWGGGAGNGRQDCVKHRLLDQQECKHQINICLQISQRKDWNLRQSKI